MVVHRTGLCCARPLDRLSCRKMGSQSWAREAAVEFSTITYEKIGRIAVVTLNRPDKFNTIRPPMPDLLREGRA